MNNQEDIAFLPSTKIRLLCFPQVFLICLYKTLMNYFEPLICLNHSGRKNNGIISEDCKGLLVPQLSGLNKTFS